MDDKRFRNRIAVNEHIAVVWDAEKERVLVLVDEVPTSSCAALLLNMSSADPEFTSIDELAERQGARPLKGDELRKMLSIDEEVRAHASNIQAWVENDYDARLLHSNISSLLSSALAAAGDEKAKKIADKDDL
jgi:hypothetical protein